MVQAGLKVFNLHEDDLAAMRKGADKKALIAMKIREETAIIEGVEAPGRYRTKI